VAASLGHGGAEIFPKQSELRTERGDQPNWIVMPYFGALGSPGAGTYGGKLREQWGLKRGGAEMTLGEFVRAAVAARCALRDVRVPRLSVVRHGTSTNDGKASTEPFSDGPPCLEHLAITKVPRGGQNNALLMMGVYFKRSQPDDWRTCLEEANAKFLDPPGSAEGLTSVIKSLKKDYLYTCKTEPMCSHCNVALCRTRAFGVGEGGNDYRADGTPEIQVTAGALSALATTGEEVLLAAGLPLYQRSGKLVRPITEEVEAAHGRRTKVARFARLDPTYLRDLLGRVARWTRYDARSKKMPIDPPPDVANTILARVGEWTFPVVAGVISCPTLRPDGSVLAEPGYDPATRLLLVEPPPMPAIKEAPTRDDALAALRLIEDLLTEFPFVDDVARAVALSAAITPVVRGAFPVAPMHGADAPVAGSGKSYLFDIVAAIAIGQIMPVMAAGRNEEETEKRLGAALLTGQSLISIDNVNGELGGDALCQAVERPVVEIRILGKSELVRIEARGTTFYCTGNNLILVGDLCRRTLIATLDPRLERPELRVFNADPVATVLADRGKFIAACLTVCRAYIAAGQPDRAPRLASFNGWSDIVRSALTWLGRADPVKSMETAQLADPRLAELRTVLAAWAEAIGVGPRYRRRLRDLIGEGEGEREPLNAALQAVAGGRGIEGVGKWMRRNKGRFADELRLANEGDPKHGSQWWIEAKNGEDRPPAPPGLPVTLRVLLNHETDAAVRVTPDSGPEVWLPKSQITMGETPDEDGRYEVTIPGWLAKDKRLLSDSEPKTAAMPSTDSEPEIPF
jgi:hypothetical protein